MDIITLSNSKRLLVRRSLDYMTKGTVNYFEYSQSLKKSNNAVESYYIHDHLLRHPYDIATMCIGLVVTCMHVGIARLF
jgi:hypothetical protein